MPRTALWVNSNTREGAIARLASRNSRNCGKPGSVRVAAATIAEQPDVAVLEQQPAHHLDAAQHAQTVELRQQRTGFGKREEVRRGDDFAVTGIEPRYRLVVAHLALRQRDDRLEIKVDPLVLDRAADQRDDGVAIEPGEGGDSARAGGFRRTSPWGSPRRRIGG